MTLRDPKGVHAFRMQEAMRSAYVDPIFGPYNNGQREYHAEWNVTAEPRVMDQIIDWKIRSPAMKLKQKIGAITEEVHLIRQFTMELRVNYADDEKNITMRKAWAQAARHVNATAQLLSDGVKPDIAIYSDDWFAGKETIDLLEDVIQQGIDENGASDAGNSVSSELMAAVRDGT